MSRSRNSSRHAERQSLAAAQQSSYDGGEAGDNDRAVGAVVAGNGMDNASRYGWVRPAAYVLPVCAAFADSFFTVRVVAEGLKWQVPASWLALVAAGASVNHLALECYGMRELLKGQFASTTAVVAVLVPAFAELGLFGKAVYLEAPNSKIGWPLALLFGGCAAVQYGIVEAKALDELWHTPYFIQDVKFIQRGTDNKWKRYLAVGATNVSSLLLSATLVGPIAREIFEHLRPVVDLMPDRFHFPVKLFASSFISVFYLSGQTALTGHEFKEMVYGLFWRLIDAIRAYPQHRCKVLCLMTGSGLVAAVHAAGAFFLIRSTAHDIFAINESALGLNIFSGVAALITWLSSLSTNGMRLLLLASRTRWFREEGPAPHLFAEQIQGLFDAAEDEVHEVEDSSPRRMTSELQRKISEFSHRTFRVRNFYITFPTLLLPCVAKIAVEATINPQIGLAETVGSNALAALPMVVVKKVVDNVAGVSSGFWSNLLCYTVGVAASTAAQYAFTSAFSTEENDLEGRMITRSELLAQGVTWAVFLGWMAKKHFYDSIDPPSQTNISANPPATSGVGAWLRSWFASPTATDPTAVAVEIDPEVAKDAAVYAGAPVLAGATSE